MRYSYPVDLTPDDNDTLLVTFPGLPPATTFGEDEADALLHARDALTEMFVHCMDERRAIPRPSKPRKGQRVVEVPPLVAAKLALYEAMRAQGVTKAALARRLDYHGPQVDRLLDLHHKSRLEHLTRALATLGKRVVLEIRDAA